jgi:L-fucose isomerase-like protein
MQADPFLLRRTIGVQLHDLSLPMFIDAVRAVDPREDVERVKAMKLPMKNVAPADLEMNSRCYLAMRQALRDEQLDAMAIQEWPELPNMLGQWPYLAIARLGAENEAVSVEGDSDGALTMLIGKLLGIGVGFITDWLEHDERTIHFWHPGMAPLSMCENPTLANHFNIQKPLVVDAPLKSDRPVTIARLWHCDGEYRICAFEGRTIAPRRKLAGNPALVEVNANAREIFDELIHAGLPHHLIMFDGEHRESLRRLARMLRVEWVG